MNDLNPTQRFLASPFAAKHAEWAKSEVSRAAVEAALSDLALSLNPVELQSLYVVRKFASTLLNLSEPPKPKKPVQSSTLRYDNPQPKN